MATLPEQTTDTSPLDHAYQQKNYHDLGCGDILLEVYRIFMDSAPHKLTQLQQLLEQGELQQAFAIAHALKGEAGSIGGRLVMTAAAEVEKLARAGNLAAALALIPQLEQQLKITVNAILRELEG